VEEYEIKQGAVYINGQILDESAYLKKDIITNGDVNTTLGMEEYFVMGDNRGVSADSRAWGVLKKKLIVGKYWIKLYTQGN
jgi:signal peptidase I